MRVESIPLYLFAKAPVAGKVKTRMQPRLSAEACARLAETMLRHSVQTAVEAWPGEVILATTPTSSHPVFDALCLDCGITAVEQRGADLGQRMGNLLRQGIAGAGGAAVMGCDVPHVTGDTLRTCHAEMGRGRNVVGPAADGGFYLLGLVSLDPSLFSGIEWGGDGVMADLEKNARRLGQDFVTLDSLRDIDKWEDLKWLASRCDRYQEFLS